MKGFKPCGLLRRLAAIIYDGMLLFPILMIATALALPLASDDAFSSQNPIFTLYLIGVCYIYFSWQWVHGGQTLGMRAWKLKVITIDNASLSWAHASLRFVLAFVSWLILAIGFLWSLFDPDKYALHDRYSKTRLIVDQD